MKYLSIDKDLFIQNRKRFAAHLKPNSVAVFNSNDIMPTSGDGVRPFIQNSDIFYLTGIDQEQSIFVIYPDANEEKNREIVFIRESDEQTVIWEGNKYSKEKAAGISGIKSIHWIEEFDRIFRELAAECEHIYLNTNEHLRAEVTVETRDARFIKWCMSAYPLHRYERLAPIMCKLRAIKSDIEIDLIRKACSITGKTFQRLLRFIRPGVWEYEIEAEIYHEFIRNRSRGPAFEPVIASGPNSCILHSVKNERMCRDGDILLVDFGAEYGNYASDITRTVPVNGIYSKRQKDIYNAVLRVQRAAISMLKPGNTLKEYQEQVGRFMEEELIGLGLLNAQEVRNQDNEKPLYKKYFMHGTSHHLGLDVHDVWDKHRKFEPGMVFTCEPGIYVRDESIGVRIENDILITAEGPIDLSADIPVEADEIEEIMSKK